MIGKVSVKYISLLVTIGLFILMYGFGGVMYTQGKRMTNFENQEWGVSQGNPAMRPNGLPGTLGLGFNPGQGVKLGPQEQDLLLEVLHGLEDGRAAAGT